MDKTNLEKFSVPFKYILTAVHEGNDVRQLTLQVLATAIVAPSYNEITETWDPSITIYIDSISLYGYPVKSIVLFNPEWKHDIYRTARTEAERFINPPPPERIALTEIRDALYATYGTAELHPLKPITVNVCGVGFLVITGLQIMGASVQIEAAGGWSTVTEEDREVIAAIQQNAPALFGKKEERHG